MLSNIKTYQSETAGQRFLSQNPPLYCTLGCLFIKGSLLILTSSCHVCLHPHKTLWLYWLGGLEGSKWIKDEEFYGFGLLLLEKKNLDSVLKSISTWNPASALNLKMWILKMKAAPAKLLNFWNLAFQKDKMDGEWTDLTLRNRTCFIGHPPRPLNQKWIAPQNPKFQLPLTYETPFIKGVVNFPKYGLK